MGDTEALIEKTVSNLKQLVDSDTVIGKCISTPDNNTMVIPVSKVTVGIVSGSGEYGDVKPKKGFQTAGGGGAGGSVSPIGFLILGSSSTRFISIDKDDNGKWSNLINSAIDLIKPSR